MRAENLFLSHFANPSGGVTMSRQAFLCFAVIALHLALALCPARAEGPNMRPGKWEITTKMELPGMPADMPQQQFVHTQCLTGDDFVPSDPKAAAGSRNCKVRDVHTSGNTVRWTMRCNTAQGEMNGKGSITYHGDSFEGVFESKMPGMKVIQHMKGRRVGDCAQ
jgi:hypothetical protein